MSESWTDPRAVLRDLRIASGRNASGRPNLTLIDDKPNFIATEEDEIDSYCSYFGVTPDDNTDFSKGADVDSISEMISMMRSSADDCIKPVETCRFDNQPVSTLVINHHKTLKPKVKGETPVFPIRASRNVAIQSLIENAQLFASTPSSSDSNNDTTEFVEEAFPPLPSPSQSSTNKVGPKLGKINKESLTAVQAIPLPVSSSSSSSSFSSSSLNFAAAAKLGKQTVKQPENKSTAVRLGPKKYVQTPRTQKIYEKMMLEDAIREILNEAVWTKLEKQMEIIDERNEKFKELAIEAQQNLLLLGYEFPLKICLPQQRHSISDDCIVCKTLCKNPEEAKLMQTITLKDITKPVPNVDEGEKNISVLSDMDLEANDMSTLIYKMVDLNLNTSSENDDMYAGESCSEYDTISTNDTNETEDISNSIEIEPSPKVIDSKGNLNTAGFKIHDFKTEFDDNHLKTNDLNFTDYVNNIEINMSNAGDAGSKASNSKMVSFNLTTVNDNDLIDSDDDSNNEDIYVNDILKANNINENTDETKLKNKSVSAREVFNKADTELMNKLDIKSSDANQSNSDLAKEMPKEVIPDIKEVKPCLKEVETDLKVTNVAIETVLSQKEEAKTYKVVPNQDPTKDKLSKHTYLRLISFLKKSTTKDNESTRIAENNSKLVDL